jgi:hypothetical protein
MTTNSREMNKLDGFKSDEERSAEANPITDKEQAENQLAVSAEAIAADVAAAEEVARAARAKAKEGEEEDDIPHELDMDAGSRRSGRMDEIRRKSLEERGLVTSPEDGEEIQGQQPASRLPENVYEKDGVLYAKLKVNGEETERPLSDALNIAQKNVAADKRLQQSSAVMSELRKQKQELDAREQRLKEATDRLQQRITNSGKAPSGEDATDLEQTAEALVDAIYRDDPKEAAEHARKLVQGRSTATPKDAEQLQAVVDSLVQEQQEIGRQKQLNGQQLAEIERQANEDWTRGVENFKKSYPDIQQGTEAWRLASSLSRAIQLEPKFENASFEQIFLEAGRRARETIKGVSPGLKDRTNRKLEASPHTASRSAATQPVRPGQQPAQRKSQHDLIRGMRQQRRPYADY